MQLRYEGPYPEVSVVVPDAVNDRSIVVKRGESADIPPLVAKALLDQPEWVAVDNKKKGDE